MRERALLIVFARLPAPGRVKTRLAAVLGDVAAAELYAAFVADLVGSMDDPRWETRWQVAAPVEDFAERFGLLPRTCVAQRGRDLGERMRDAFRLAREDGFARTVLIGSDAPQLDATRIAEAFAALGPVGPPGRVEPAGTCGADLVLGPALDGGYYLIAMREPHDVFEGIAWSTPQVLEATLDRARARGLRTRLLQDDFDVDDAAALDRLGRLVAGSAGSAGKSPAMPATRAALARLRGADRLA
ncbi:MAG: hypothetical protein RL698_2141 [Pseudomonadota bacterium]